MESSFFDHASQEVSKISGLAPSPGFSERPPWAGPIETDPNDALKLDLLVASSDVADVVLSKIGLYADGWLFDISAIARPPFDHSVKESRIKWRKEKMESLRPRRPGLLPDGLLRMGVQLSDGRKATTLDYVVPPVSEPVGVLLMEISGAGYRVADDEISIGHSLWLWPLIKRRDWLDFVVEWPALGISLARTRIDFDQIAGSVP